MPLSIRTNAKQSKIKKYDMDKLVLDPKTEKLKAEVEELRKKFLTLYTQKDDMICTEREDLYIRYLNEIGHIQYENYQLQVEVRALKRKVELAQSYVNRGQNPDIKFIDNQVKIELKEYYKQIEQQQEALKVAQEVDTISKFDLKEMHDIYRVLVKRLHPDLNPDQQEKDVDLFVKVQAAYHTHNIDLLREIVMRLKMDEDVDALVSKNEDSVNDMKMRLQRQIVEIEHDIAYLLTTFPFNVRSLLEDPEALAKKKEELKQEHDELIEQKRIYAERFQLITED